jgi:hypothetical protein
MSRASASSGERIHFERPSLIFSALNPSGSHDPFRLARHHFHRIAGKGARDIREARLLFGSQQILHIDGAVINRHGLADLRSQQRRNRLPGGFANQIQQRDVSSTQRLHTRGVFFGPAGNPTVSSPGKELEGITTEKIPEGFGRLPPLGDAFDALCRLDPEHGLHAVVSAVGRVGIGCHGGGPATLRRLDHNPGDA